MKTPTTITCIAWNYCQNRCSYCVSESNTDQWKVNSKKEVWKPEGKEDLNFYQLADKYGMYFHHDMCPEPDKYFEAREILDFDYVIEWVKKYRPGAHIHISGGEPLLRPDIEDVVEKVSAEFETTIVTNGQLISKRPRLLDMPVKWLVSYHLGQVDVNYFLQQISLIKDKPHLITQIKDQSSLSLFDHFPDATKMVKNTNSTLLANEYNFELKENAKERFNLDFEYNPEDLNDIASHRIMIIQPNGPVVGCNKPHYGTWDRWISESNVYAMTCDENDLATNNERAKRCVMNNRCSAYQTAVKVYNLGE